jgi:hypothetical protein
VRRFRCWVTSWGETLMAVVGVALFATQGLYSFWGPFGAVLAVVAVVMMVKDAQERRRKAR